MTKVYHIHEKPVPADGNCTGTGAHLDPYKRGETPPCDASKPETCQTGDLSGKHGNLTTSPAESKAYVFPFLLLSLSNHSTNNPPASQTCTPAPTPPASPSWAPYPSSSTPTTKPA